MRVPILDSAATSTTDVDNIHDNTEIELGTDPNDPFDFPPVPASRAAGLLLLIVVLGTCGVLMLVQSRTAKR